MGLGNSGVRLSELQGWCEDTIRGLRRRRDFAVNGLLEDTVRLSDG